MRFSRVFIPLLLVLPLSGYAPHANPSKPVSWRQMVRQSGYIFSGTVTKVERVSPRTQNEVAAVRITFLVDQAVLGAQKGQKLEVREWSGLWDSPERYREGERVFLFLYPSSRLGLTSPVGGSLGRFAIDSQGQMVIDRGRSNPLSTRPDSTSTAQAGKIRTSASDFAHAMQRVSKE